MMTSIHELLQKEAQAVLNIPITDAYEKAVELIVEQIHRKKGKLVTTGMGSYEYSYDFLLYRYSGCVFTSQRSPTWGFGDFAGE